VGHFRLTDSQRKNGEIDENVEAMDVLAEEVVAKQQEVIDVTSALDDYRDKAEIVYWAGDVVIVVLVIALIYVARQN
jgi:hypothetical protein